MKWGWKYLVMGCKVYVNVLQVCARYKIYGVKFIVTLQKYTINLKPEVNANKNMPSAAPY